MFIVMHNSCCKSVKSRTVYSYRPISGSNLVPQTANDCRQMRSVAASTPTKLQFTTASMCNQIIACRRTSVRVNKSSVVCVVVRVSQRMRRLQTQRQEFRLLLQSGMMMQTKSLVAAVMRGKYQCITIIIVVRSFIII